MIKKLNLKLFIENPEVLQLDAVIPVFHGWIRDNLLPGLPIDVANYTHVPDGPGLMLIGYDGDYAIDLANGRPGVWYSHKRDWPESDLAGQIRLAWSHLITAAQLLQDDPTLAIAIGTAEIELALVDRLLAPNNVETFTAVQGEVQAAFTELLGSGVTVVWANEDARRPFTLRISSENAPTIADLSANKATA